jgi:S-formylglutathione hydrolase FrmB
MIRIFLGCLLAIQIAVWPVRAETAVPVVATNAAPKDAADTTAAPAPAAPLDLAGCTVEKFTVNSPSMGRDIKVAVILPPGYADNSAKQYPILYTMHGVAAAYDCFSAMSTLLSGLKEKPMVVAMFDADNSSFYVDATLPQRYSRVKTDTSMAKSLFTTFFFDEYIPALDKKYRINPKQRMLTGFSMGGYGAFHYMLTKPEMFCSVSSMSGAFMDLSHIDDKIKAWMERLDGPMADHAAEYQAMDTYAQVKALADKGVKLPPIRLRCGTEDKLVVGNQKMRDLLKSLNIPCEYEESPGGHNWKFWKTTMPDILDFHWRMLQGK